MKKTVLITGAAVRVGRALALRFAEAGYPIAVHYHKSAEAADNLARTIEGKGGRCSLFQADLTVADNIPALMDNVFSRCGAPELLINSASAFIRGAIRETGTAQLEECFRLNLFAPFLLTREYAAQTETGSVINILDTKISSGRSQYAAYTLSKQTLEAFTRMAALEFAPGIRVNGVAPGVLIDNGGEGFPMPDPAVLPLQRRCSIDDFINTVRFLHETESLTGQIIFTDGGNNLCMHRKS